MNYIRLVRGADQKIHFSVFDDAHNREPINMSMYYDIVFEVFNTLDDRPIVKKTVGTNEIVFGQGANEITVFVSADDTMRFSANGFKERCNRLYRLTGIRSSGERHLINEGAFYSEPSGGGANVLCGN